MLFAIAKSIFNQNPANITDELVEDLSQNSRDAALSDEELMIRYAGGELDAFSQLVKRHERPLYNFILRSCRRPDLAQELLQDVFMRVIQSAARYQQSAKFTTWIYTIARNLCIDHARKHGRHTEISLNQSRYNSADAASSSHNDGPSQLDSLADTAPRSASADHERNEFRTHFLAALDALPEDQREVFIMREISGLKFQEIAEIIGCPLPTTKSRMRYALESLRLHLAAYRDHSFDEQEENMS